MPANCSNNSVTVLDLETGALEATRILYVADVHNAPKPASRAAKRAEQLTAVLQALLEKSKDSALDNALFRVEVARACRKALKGTS